MRLCTTKECATEYHMSDQTVRKRFREIQELINNGVYSETYEQRPTLLPGEKKRSGLVNDVVFAYHETHRGELLRCGRKAPITWEMMQ